MHRSSHIRLLLLSVCLLWVGRAVEASSDDALLVIVHPSVSEETWSKDSLGAIFTLSRRDWSNGRTIVPYNYEPGNALRTQFDRTVLGFNEQQSARFWIDFRIRGGGLPPRRVPSVALMVRVIAHLPGAIGYVPAGTVTEGTRVVARIANNQVMVRR